MKATGTLFACGIAWIAGACGNVKDRPRDASVDSPTGTPMDAPPPVDASLIDGPLAVPVKPVAPTVENPMYQGSQTRFKTQLGTTCTGRVAASMGGKGFCYLAASDDVKCSGEIGDVSYGMTFGAIGQTNATQLMVMFGDDGMCVTKTDHTVLCMTSNSNAFGTMISPASFTRWTAHADVVALATGTWDQICGITTAGQVFCGGGGMTYGNPPVNVGLAGQSGLWVDTSGMARLSDTAVLRPAESRTECQVKATGLVCAGTTFGPTNGTIVMGSNIQATGGGTNTCWLTDDGSVNCNVGPRFAPGKVLFLAADYYTDSLCAIYNDGAVWCIGSNSNGKLGTGNTAALAVETMVAPPGSARVSCD